MLHSSNVISKFRVFIIFVKVNLQKHVIYNCRHVYNKGAKIQGTKSTGRLNFLRRFPIIVRPKKIYECHFSETYNFEVARRFLENLWPPGIKSNAKFHKPSNPMAYSSSLPNTKIKQSCLTVVMLQFDITQRYNLTKLNIFPIPINFIISVPSLRGASKCASSPCSSYFL
jgi:hypothetical protein